MAYKRISPTPIVEGGTNTKTFATTDGTAYFDGTKINVTATGTATQVLTSNGAGMAPTYQAASGGSGMGILPLLGEPLGPGGPDNIVCLATTGSKSWHSPFGYRNPITGVDTVQAYNNFIMPIAVTALNLFVYVTSNASTSPLTVTLNVNGSNTALVATIPAGTTGAFSDTTHTVSVSQGQIIQWEISAAVTGQVFGTISMSYHT
jgi:hypothetical protein